MFISFGTINESDRRKRILAVVFPRLRDMRRALKTTHFDIAQQYIVSSAVILGSTLRVKTPQP